MFTCDVTGASANPAAVWTISGLNGLNLIERVTGKGLDGNNDRITTTDIGGNTPNSTITITGFNTSDNGGTIQCINQDTGSVQGMANISLGE